MAIVLPHVPDPSTWFAHKPSTRPATHRKHIGQWTLEITHDPFANKTHCLLRAREMRYGPAAVTFKFGPGVDTFGAMYRIDDGPAVSWRVNAMTLASRGVVLQTDNLTNASGGQVFVPTSAIEGAQSITIRPRPNDRARTYRLKDLPQALDAAQQAQCGPEFDGDDSE